MDNIKFWEDIIGSNLSILLEKADYEQHSREYVLGFCYKYVTPFLGPQITCSQPRKWRSFMTDDFSPLEFSWTWDSSPKIRFSFEPAAHESGELCDYFNRQAPLRCVEGLRTSLLGSDWTWFDSFVDSFYELKADTKPTRPPDVSSPSSIFLALELGRSGDLEAKAYCMPVRAEQTGSSRVSILKESILQLQSDDMSFPGFTALEQHITTADRNTPLEIVLVGVDCLVPSLSRLKVYLRSPETSFSSVCANLTMRGNIASWTPGILKELKELWYLVLGCDEDHAVDASLPPFERETGGVLYNFNIPANQTVPDAKVYIPVKHYGKNDREVLNGLVLFLNRRGRNQDTAKFLAAVEQLCYYRDLQAGCGLQTYISCAVKKGELSLTSYLSPELHHPGRWA